MKTFMFLQKNGSAIVTVKATSEDEAWGVLQELVKNWHEWSSPECEDDNDLM